MRIKMLEEIHEEDIKYFGRKAFYLGAMNREGFRVPKGFGIFLSSGVLNHSNTALISQHLKALGLDKKSSL